MWNEMNETLPLTADEWERIGQFKRMTNVELVTYLDGLTDEERGNVSQLLDHAQDMEAAAELDIAELHDRTVEHLTHDKLTL